MPRQTSANEPPAAPPAFKPAEGANAWDELGAVLDELVELARTETNDERFSRELIRCCVVALSADAGAFWRADRESRMRREVTEGVSQGATDDHEALLSQAITERTIQSRTFASTKAFVIVAPVVADASQRPSALIEVTLHGNAAPSVYQAANRFLEAVAEIAADRQLRSDIRLLRDELDQQRQLAGLARRIQRGGDLRRTCYQIANETRKVVGCDRISVLASPDGQQRLIAVSGVELIDRRTQTSRGLESLARIVHQLDEPLSLVDGEPADLGLPDAEQAIQRYADQSHARQITAIPLHAPNNDEQEGPRIVGVLVAEEFDATADELARQRLADAADAVSPALATAVELAGVPLLGLARSLRWCSLPSTVRRLAAGLVVAMSMVAVLALTPAEFTIESVGKVQPVEQQQIFAPRNAVVESIAVEHGEHVEAGQSLLSLRDPELELSISQLEGEIATTNRQLDATRALRGSDDMREKSPTEAYRLSGEEQRLRVRHESLLSELAFLKTQRERLHLVATTAGEVTSWQIDQSLLGRPVQRGQSLLTVANTTGNWQIELQTPDNRIGHVLAAQSKAKQSKAKQPLRVEYRLASEEHGTASGVVTQIAQRAEPSIDAGQQPTVLVVVRPDDPLNPANDPRSVRPGQSVVAKIHCGRRSLGYVWFHDLWHVVRTWWEF